MLLISAKEGVGMVFVVDVQCEGSGGVRQVIQALGAVGHDQLEANTEIKSCKEHSFQSYISFNRYLTADVGSHSNSPKTARNFISDVLIARSMLYLPDVTT